MQNMDAASLYRFSGTCRTFRKLVDQHPEMLRKCIYREFSHQDAYTAKDDHLRSIIRMHMLKKKTDPIICAVLAKKEEKKQKELEAKRRKEAERRRNKQLRGDKDNSPLEIYYYKSTRPTFWERREAAIAAAAATCGGTSK